MVVTLVLGLFPLNLFPHLQKQSNKIYFQDSLCGRMYDYLMQRLADLTHIIAHLPLATGTILPLRYDSKSSWASSLKPFELVHVILHVGNTQLTNGIRRRFTDR